jgi:acetyltransferase-like isoleucine patch superfamily enzyme
MGELTIGKHSYGRPIRRGTGNNITIGKYCSIADRVIFDGGFNHETKYISTYPFHLLSSNLGTNISIKGDINIGNDVWIGEDVIIMSGVTVGDGAVIGAKALVTKDVPPYCIYGGVPAKIIRQRFTGKQVDELLKIKWWDWEDSKVIENSHLLYSDKIEEFISIHKL